MALILLLGGEPNATIEQYREATLERQQRLAARRQELIAVRARAEAETLLGWPS